MVILSNNTHSDIAIIHVLSPKGISNEVALDCLTKKEHDRAKRFHFIQDATRWISFRAQMRIILGEQLKLPPRKVPLLVSDFGKPLLDSPYNSLHFNLTHCEDLGLLALSISGPVGVDIEPRNRACELSECVETFCHPNEITALPDTQKEREMRLLEIWTTKEAALKALGSGFSHPPKTVIVSFEKPNGSVVSDLRLSGVENLQTHVLLHPTLDQYRAVLVTTNCISHIEFLTEFD